MKKKISFLFFIPVLFASVSSNTSYAQIGKPQLFKSGDYDAFFIAYDSTTRKLTGYLSQTNGDRNSCNIYVEGTSFSENPEVNVTIYQPWDEDSIRYSGVVSRRKDDIEIKSSEAIWPCQSFVNIRDGESFEYASSRDYYKISLISVDKQSLYKSPDEQSKLRSYLIKNDPVGILAQEKDWLLICYLKNEKVKAWIPVSSVF